MLTASLRRRLVPALALAHPVDARPGPARRITAERGQRRRGGHLGRVVKLTGGSPADANRLARVAA
jgi:hypothetical protein